MTSELLRSYEMVGRILEALVANGLRRSFLHADDFEADGDYGALFRDTLLFLRAEGLIRFEDDNQEVDGSCADAQLTSRGIAALEDGRFNKGQSVRERLDDEKGSVSGETYSKIGSFVGGVFGGFTSSIA